jgi:hypothetical protein
MLSAAPEAFFGKPLPANSAAQYFRASNLNTLQAVSAQNIHN